MLPNSHQQQPPTHHRLTSSPGEALPEFSRDSMGPQRRELAMGSKEDKVGLKNQVDLLRQNQCANTSTQLWKGHKDDFFDPLSLQKWPFHILNAG